jgi:serine/threonine protein kinase
LLGERTPTTNIAALRLRLITVYVKDHHDGGKTYALEVNMQRDTVGHLKASIHRLSNGRIPIFHMKLLHSGNELADERLLGNTGITHESTVCLMSCAPLSNWFVPITEIVEGNELGYGSYGKVAQATWQGASQVAIKKLHHLGAGADTLVRECHTNVHIRHPNIVQFLGIGVDAKLQPRMLVMELMRGGSLCQMLSECQAQQQAIELGMQVSIVTDVCCALCYLHSRQPPILHLDIKPANILLDHSRRRAKLADLGESHVIKSLRQQSTRSPYGIGTPLYMAPEMRMKDADKSGQTDMFSLGVVMVELASNRQPTPEHELQQQESGQLLPVSETLRRARDIAAMPSDHPFNVIVEHLIVDSPLDRWDASQVLQQLKRIPVIESEPV